MRSREGVRFFFAAIACSLAFVIVIYCLPIAAAEREQKPETESKIQMHTPPKNKNRLAKEKSPYLLQHASNPVDWFPWGAEAFVKAAKEDKPIFLSIGYSTCHWCHVMERESFENEEIARLLNENFVAIKVDREERQDIDQIYMNAVQALTGSGGWPLTVFLTPDRKPFTGGTYFPPEDRWGRIGMKALLVRIAELWKQKRGEIEKAGSDLALLLQPPAADGSAKLSYEKIFRQTFEGFQSQFDPASGGFGGAPKFPRSHELSFLLRYWDRAKAGEALRMTELTLERMARGGMYDQLGGGFHRYSTDDHWLVPHFEKMLYDQAILARTYLEAYQATQNSFYADAARDIFRYVLRDLSDPQGAFYSAEDADSEGEEGKFYVWRPEEIRRILGRETGDLFNEFYGVTDEGNFEHAASILHVSEPLEAFARRKNFDAENLKESLARAREKLFAVREQRIRPHRDDKILTAWNGLMISSLAYASQALEDPSYAQKASQAADFILKKMQKNGRLLRRWRGGEASVLAFQDDYAFLSLGLLDLYEATFEIRWLEEARRLTREMLRLFSDEKSGGFYYSGTDGEALIARTKEYYDGAVPSGNSVAALVMLRLGKMTSDADLLTKAEAVLRSNAAGLEQHPTGFPQMLIAADFALGPSYEIVFAGKKEDESFKKMLGTVRRRFLPRRVLLHHPEGGEAAKIESIADFIKNQKAKGDRPAVYVCQNYQCRFPATDEEELKKIVS